MKRLGRFALLALCMALLCVLAGCSQGTGKTMKIDAVDTAKNTFNFVDTKSGETLAYETLILDGKTVADHICMESLDKSVVFAFDNDTIVREGNTTKINGGQGITIHATRKYTLEDGVLTIVEIE